MWTENAGIFGRRRDKRLDDTRAVGLGSHDRHPSLPLEASQHGKSVVDDAFVNDILAATPMFRGVCCRYHVIVLRGLRPKGEVFLNVVEESPWSVA